MDPAYSTAHSFPVLTQAQWAEDMKPGFPPAPVEPSRRNSTLDSTGLSNPSSLPDGRPANLKVEDEIHNTEHMWQNTMHDPYADHMAVPHGHLLDRHDQHMYRVSESAMVQMPPAQWPTSQSGSSTPTQTYGHQDGFAPMSYGAVDSTYPYQPDPTSAVPMSPQSSQGGWASAASSDGLDQRGLMQSPVYRPPSPSLVVRSDGIRKKNARFEIPKDRNLSNIDAMIQQTTDENEKKELKQQKRLLRNRQAALDSRQRKKTHTEKLEQEKKVSEKKMFDLEETLARLENTLNVEREQWMQQRQQFDQFIHSLSYERDEAIRTKTLDTAELRRQNNILKDCVRDLERQQHKPYAPLGEINAFPNDFNDYGLGDQYNEGYAFIDGDDYKMEDAEHAPQQNTPRPLPAQGNIDAKAEGFSWNTFYMCLLFGAFLAANGNSSSHAPTTTSAIASSISPAEAGNVLKAVLKHSDSDVVPSRGINQATSNVQSSLMDNGPGQSAPSALESLHHALSTPSRHQELQAAFSMSAASYNHIVDPFNDHLNTDTEPEVLPAPKPSQLQQAFADMKAQKEEMERANGIGAKLRDRSLLWDQVPPQVVKDFQDLVRSSGSGLTSTNNAEQSNPEGPAS